MSMSMEMTNLNKSTKNYFQNSKGKLMAAELLFVVLFSILNFKIGSHASKI